MATELRVPDASCGHCKMTIEQAVSGVEGVRDARFDLETKTLTVEYAGTDDALVRAAIAGAGYTPEDMNP